MIECQMPVHTLMRTHKGTTQRSSTRLDRARPGTPHTLAVHHAVQAATMRMHLTADGADRPGQVLDSADDSGLGSLRTTELALQCSVAMQAASGRTATRLWLACVAGVRLDT
jgi:hypothetical protein